MKKEFDGEPVARIMIQGQQVECLIGVFPHEKSQPQTLLVDLSLEVPLAKTAQSDALADALDYAAIADDVKFILVHGKFQLIETAAACLLAYLLAPFARERRLKVRQAAVTIHKPAALGPAGGIAAVSVQGSSREMAFAWSHSSLGERMTLFQNERLVLQALTVPAQGETPLYTHASTHVAEKPAGCSEGLQWSEGRHKSALPRDGASAQFAPGCWRRYRNTTDEPATLLQLLANGDQRVEFLLDGTAE